jgi:glycosyltransferase involved in cell wall biosynthesis
MEPIIVQNSLMERSSGSEKQIPNTASFAVSRQAIPSRQSIALLSEHGDPAVDIGREEAGGQNVYVRKVGEALSRLGWQVDMFTRKSSPDDETIVHHTPHCRTIRLKAGPEQFIPRERLFEHMPAFVESFLQFQAKDGGNYPLIHTNYWMSGWAGLQLKQVSNVQLVHTYHSLGVLRYQNSAKPPIAQLRLAVERNLLEQGDCIVATSPQELEQLRTLVSPRGNIEVIPCGTDLETFHVIPQAEAREKLGFRPDEKVVLYVGRFDPRKGIETLVRAFAQLNAIPEARTQSSMLRLVMVGGCQPGQLDHEERARIVQLVRELGIAAQTTFTGQVGHDRLPWYYTAADVCVIPSVYEPFGLVAIEAMACGTPVVASDVGGLKFTVVPGETGLLVAPNDVQGFTIAMHQVLSMPEWSDQVKEQEATTWVQEHFSWAGVAAQLSDLYRRQLALSLLDMAPVDLMQSTVPQQPTTLPQPSIPLSA